VKSSSRRMTALVSSAVLASSLAACDSDTTEAADSSDASTSTQLKGTAVQGDPTPLEVLMESGKPEGDYRYTADHLWAKKLADGTVEFGLTNFAQEALGDIVYLEFPTTSSKCEVSKPCGTVESTKSVTGIFLPFSGTVTETNTELVPEKINQNPYGSWLIRLKPDDPNAFDSLGKIPT
jgi:glycine cleavage system H protein